jgi:hypothetical protein
MEDELPNPDLEVTFIVRIEDVTTKVLEGVSSLSTEAERQKKNTRKHCVVEQIITKRQLARK